DPGAINRRGLESLIKAGAFDSAQGNRAQQFAVIDSAIETGQRAWKDKQFGQAGLFAMAMDDQPAHAGQPLPALDDWTPQQKLSGEKEMLGIYVTGHPLDEFADKVRELATHDTERLEGLERGADVALCGILTGVQRKRNKKGEPYAQMVLEDRLGTVEAMVFAKQYNDVLPSLAEDKAVLVRGVVVPQVDAPTKLSVLSVIPLESARVHLPSLISIRVSVGTNGTRDKAEALNQLFDKKRGDTEVRLRIEKARDFSVILDVATKVRPDKEFQAEIERICGPEAVEVLAS
ncbi:MAG TPA: OB-fold nucleic acid binding domain-containing protein, partial [Bryobacteraceae bacterium]|nr:OB-fold nucleic acid binding domain-containing protein [Bryobacteraceae bacterium]